MARIVNNPLLANLYSYLRDEGWEATFSAEMTLYNDMLEEDKQAEEQGEYKGGLFRYSVADGQATYRLVSLRPLVVEHLHIGDGYRNDRLVSKLNTAEIKEEIDRNRKMRGLFGG